MKYTLCVIFILSVLIVPFTSESVEEGFNANEVLPDVVGFAPIQELLLTFEGGERVNLGNELTPTQTKNMPNVEFDGNVNDYYTLLGVDLDPPDSDLMRETLHLMIVNIPGDKISEGEVKASYMGPVPSEDEDLHRYVFLVYKQPNKQLYKEPIYDTIESREHFSTVKFAEKYSLDQPKYANFFQA